MVYLELTKSEKEQIEKKVSTVVEINGRFFLSFEEIKKN